MQSVPRSFYPVQGRLLKLTFALAIGFLLIAVLRLSDPERIPNALADGDSASRVIANPSLGLGPVRIPCALPPWIDGDPLALIARQLEIGDGGAGRDLLFQLLAERRGALILPAGEGTRLSSGIDPPWSVLSQWYHDLPTSSRERLQVSTTFAEREFADGPVDAASPLLWLPGLEDLALQRLERAIEEGDRRTTLLLSRRTELLERIHPTLRRWITPAPATFSNSDHPPPTGTLRRIAALPLDLSANPLDNLEVRPLPKSRRVPLTELQPIVGGELAILPGLGGPFAVELDQQLRRAWTLPALYPKNLERSIHLRDAPWYGAVTRNRLILPVRTPRKEYSQTIEWVHTEDPWREFGWIESAIYRWDGLLQPPAPIASTKPALEGFTFGGPPLLTKREVFWLATRGFDEVETWMFAFDLRSGKELWRRELGAITRPWHSMNDLAGLIPEGRIIEYRDELIAVIRGGWIARVGRSKGDLRGALLYARHIDSTRPAAKWSRYYFKKLPAYRPRYTCDAWVVNDAKFGDQLIALPPDAKQVLGIDLAKWRIAWAHPVTPLTVLRKDDHGVPWLIDLFTPKERYTIQLSSLEPGTGKLRTPRVKLDLATPNERQRQRRSSGLTPSEEDVAPLVSGVPQLLGNELAVPLRKSWAFWSLDPLIGGLPQRQLPWPEGSSGGSVTPVDHHRYLILHRSEPHWGTRSTLELLTTAPPEE